MTRPSSSSKPPPRALWLALGAQLWFLATWHWALFLSWRVIPLLDPENRMLLAAGGMWQWLVAGLLMPLFHRRRWAWAAFVAVFLTRAAGSMLGLVRTGQALLQMASGGPSGPRIQIQPSSWLIPAVTTALSVGAGVLLFRAADWFGVEHRRAWRTTFREAWWAWILCGLMGVALPLLLQLTRGLLRP